MTLIAYKSIAALVIFLISIAIIIYPLRKKCAPQRVESLELGEAFASGIFLGAAFFHLLPDAIKTFQEILPDIHFPLAEVVAVGGFLLLLFLERLSLTFASFSSKQTVPYLLALILIIHAVTEGAALGIGTHISETIMLFIAIVAHKGSESFALCMILLRHALPLSRVFWIIVCFALMTPLGIGLGTLMDQYQFVSNIDFTKGIFNAFAAGTFLYISTLHHVHFHQHSKDTQGLMEFTSLTVGAAVMAVIALWA